MDKKFSKEDTWVFKQEIEAEAMARVIAAQEKREIAHRLSRESAMLKDACGGNKMLEFLAGLR